MKQLIPYLNFNGKCREAMEFYEGCFGEAEVSIQTFGDAPVDDMPEEAKQGVMHAEFKSDGLFMLASDGRPGQDFIQGNDIHLSIALDDTDEQTRLFNALAADGEVLMPLQDTFWNSRFGIRWMLNVPLEA